MVRHSWFRHLGMTRVVKMEVDQNWTPFSMEFVTRNLPLCHEKSWNNWIPYIYQIYPPKKGFLRWIHVKSRLLIDVPFRFAIPNPPQNSGGFKWYTQCLCCPWDAAQNCPSHQRVNQATVFAWEDSRSISRHSDEWVAVLTFNGEPVLSIFCQPFLAHSYRFCKNIPTQNWMFFFFLGCQCHFSKIVVTFQVASQWTFFSHWHAQLVGTLCERAAIKTNGWWDGHCLQKYLRWEPTLWKVWVVLEPVNRGFIDENLA